MKYLIILFMLITNSLFANSELIITYTIYKEAADQSLVGKLAVATVIYNRSIKSGKSFSYECQKPYQFSCWNGLNQTKTPKYTLNNKIDTNAWVKCQTIAKSMLDGSFKPIMKSNGESVNWNQYYNPKLCNPSWGYLMIDVKMIGDHKFGTLN